MLPLIHCLRRRPNSTVQTPSSTFLFRNLSYRYQTNQRIRADYIDRWHDSTVKPLDFYEKHAASLRRKSYFYSVDLQGRVFLEETLPKNIATSLKSAQFLDFFFTHIRRIQPKERDFLGLDGAENDYPYVSPCGIEMNYVRPADSVIVFHTLKTTPKESLVGERGMELMFGATLTQPFFANQLYISKRSGRFYHLLSLGELPFYGDNDLGEGRGITRSRRKYPTPLHKPNGMNEFGLFKSSLAVTLSEHIVPRSSLDEAKFEDYSGVDFSCPFTNKSYPIAWLPDEAEPGPWALPPEPDDKYDYQR